MKYILGISAFYHDSAAALLEEGKVIAAAQEERFTRKKHDASFPINAINFCLDYANINLNDVEFVAFYDKPFLKFERLLETYLAFAPRGFRSFAKAIPLWLKEKLFLKTLLEKQLKKIDKNFSSSRLLFGEHHFSHAASAFYPSPFKDAVVLTIDGVGEWATTTVAIGRGAELKIVKEIHFPHSLGLLYSAFTYYAGFRVNSGEYKLMGLAPYGKPKYKQIILENLIDIKEDGSFRLNMKYFNYPVGLTMVNKDFCNLFKQKVRKPDEEEITQFHMDIAASIQEVTELIVLKLTRALAKEYNLENLCLAGGVALNCVANGKIIKDKAFKNLWIQPASGDAGGSLGAAFSAWHHELKNPRHVNGDMMKGSYLGPSYNQKNIEKILKLCGAKFSTYSFEEIIELTSDALEKSLAIGWFQGRMEFGPRSLGSRSILGDPRSGEMQKTLNLKIKYRESFRPFAPSVLAEEVQNWFSIDTKSPYMLLVDSVKDDKKIIVKENSKKLFGIDKLNVIRSVIPAVTHVDYSARIQTVHKDTNPEFHSLIKSFYKKTGCPVLINTSFNVRGEPIVNSPEDAFKCFMGTELDVLVVGNSIMYKDDQDKSLAQDYKGKYKLD